MSDRTIRGLKEIVVALNPLTRAQLDTLQDAIQEIEYMRSIIENVPWKSCEKDNMEFSAKITFMQMDQIRKVKSGL